MKIKLNLVWGKRHHGTVHFSKPMLCNQIM